MEAIAQRAGTTKPAIRRRWKSQRHAVWRPRREACIASLSKGRERGDLRPDLDVALVLDLFAAPIVFRALFGHRGLEPRFPEDVARAVLSGVGTGETCRRRKSG
jgi:hypothetical protein